MQIVIDIPEEILNSIKTFKGKFICGDGYDLIQCIKDGTLLPKGHGRLVDADRLETHFIGTEQGTDLEVYLEPTIINAPTVIEADKEGDAK